MTDISPESATNMLLSSLEARATRRTFLKGAVATGVAITGMEALTHTAGAQTTAADTPVQIFSIAATAERLAVTFYTNGMNNATALGLSADALETIQAALIEEQIHELFFEKNGGVALTSTFSFPKGAMTFTDLPTFIATQQQLEGAFDSAFIAAGYEFSQMGKPDLCRVACQIAMVESEHRALGRRIGSLVPADNWTYAPQLVPTVGAAPAVLTAAGYLSPVAGNTYSYAQVDFSTGALAAVAANIMYQSGPFVATS
ncbi:MAG: ferritin-like domain-containing protein [Chloroflexota bacterium]